MPSPPEEIRHAVAIAGSVSNATTGQAIVGAIVEVVDQNLRTLTREDGGFYFIDVPAGSYKLNISTPRDRNRYAAIDGLAILVQKTAEGRPVLDPKARVQLKPTTLSGRVIRADNNQPIVGAVVQLRWSATQTLTDKEGRYILSGLLAGSPTIQAAAKGFSASIQTVVLAVGQETIANFSLSLAS